ncbi:MAG: sigma-70 family RNA polymerase sigma factor [Lachnospiraceae bacterium]|nr:sigma-70 family RNA polymerase sigma factor [Lachnospiraceae bacterium]
MEDNEIIELFWQRSQRAIVETDGKYGWRLQNLSMNILHDREDAEECVNDTYHATWNTLPPQRPVYFFAYLAKLARNFSFGKYDYYHAQKRDVTVVELSDEIENCIPSPNDLEQRMDSKEIGRIISEFLYIQPVEMRMVFVRRYWYMESVKDIAHVFHISESKVKSILFRMRNKLREHLEKEGVHL